MVQLLMEIREYTRKDRLACLRVLDSNIPGFLKPDMRDDFTDYLVQFCEFLAADGQRPHVMAVCQPGVPMTVAAALMAESPA